MAMELATRPWDQQEQEPPEWYRIFRDYYLPLGDKRSLRGAFEFFVRVEEPINYAEVNPDDIRFAPQHWGEMADTWNWGKRAMAFDEEVRPDIAEVYVSTVLKFLQAHAKDAAVALVQALQNERTRVQAANSILNRAGVPESSEVVLKAGMKFTSDDMNAAQARLEEWQRNKSG